MSTTLPEHLVHIECAVSPQVARAFLADGQRLGRWALGAMSTVEVAPGLVRGVSLFDESKSYIRLVEDAAAGTVTYHVGSSQKKLAPRIQALVTPSPGGCIITLRAQRTPEMGDARWLRLIRCHEVEILLIQAQLEHLPHL